MHFRVGNLMGFRAGRDYYRGHGYSAMLAFGLREDEEPGLLAVYMMIEWRSSNRLAIYTLHPTEAVWSTREQGIYCSADWTGRFITTSYRRPLDRIRGHFTFYRYRAPKEGKNPAPLNLSPAVDSGIVVHAVRALSTVSANLDHWLKSETEKLSDAVEDAVKGMSEGTPVLIRALGTEELSTLAVENPDGNQWWAVRAYPFEEIERERNSYLNSIYRNCLERTQHIKTVPFVATGKLEPGEFETISQAAADGRIVVMLRPTSLDLGPMLAEVQFYELEVSPTPPAGWIGKDWGSGTTKSIASPLTDAALAILRRRDPEGRIRFTRSELVREDTTKLVMSMLRDGLIDGPFEVIEGDNIAIYGIMAPGVQALKAADDAKGGAA